MIKNPDPLRKENRICRPNLACISMGIRDRLVVAGKIICFELVGVYVMTDEQILRNILSTDTIAALSTPRGRGAIGIVRISGAEALRIAESVFRPGQGRQVSTLGSRHLYHGRLINPNTGETVDEVLVALMRKPNSYTGEDMVEIHAHGGIVLLDTILDLVNAQGARLARPGEFTQRAFLNGKLSLTQAEAVADLIDAKTETARKLAIRALEGRPAEKMGKVRVLLENASVQLETSLDFPTEDTELDDLSQIFSLLEEASQYLAELLQLARERIQHLHGLRNVICGKRKVGKSSLLNRLLGRDRALVTEYPGTTRDTVEEDAVLEGVLLHLVDTAGIGKSDDPVERLGLQRTAEAVQEADLALFVVDTSQEPDSDDQNVYELLKHQLGEDLSKRVILVANKVDLVRHETAPGMIEDQFPGLEMIPTSALTGQGLDVLRHRLASHAQASGPIDEASYAGVHGRQKVLLVNAAKDIESAMLVLKKQGSRPELAAEDLKTAIQRLEELDGVRICPDLLNAIFSRFCIGK